MRMASSRGVLLASAIVLFACSALSASDAVITVRVINGKTGAPVKGAVVRLSGFKSSPYAPLKGGVVPGLLQDWTGKTDATGSVKFDINEPTNSWAGHNGMAAGTIYHTSQPAKWLKGGG